MLNSIFPEENNQSSKQKKLSHSRLQSRRFDLSDSKPRLQAWTLKQTNQRVARLKWGWGRDEKNLKTTNDKVDLQFQENIEIGDH